MSLRVSILNGDNPSWNDYDVQALQSDFGESGIVFTVARDFLQVIERPLPDNYVRVKAGIAYIKITKNGETYMVKLKNSDNFDIQVPANVSGNPRKDIIIARIDTSTEPDNTSSNIGLLELLEGTPDPSPVEPAVPNNAIKLATLDVAHGQTVFLNADKRTVFIINNLGLRLPNNVPLQSRNAGDENLPVDLFYLDESNILQIMPPSKFNAEVDFVNYIPTLPDTDPTLDNEIARKKYVDDEITALEFTKNIFGSNGEDGALNITSGTVNIPPEFVNAAP